MEKPDVNGFINVKWPSKNIPHGGVFHTKTLQPSAEREKFLKVLLEESKLTIAQRRQDSWKLRENSEDLENIKFHSRPVSQVRPRTSRRRSQSEIRDSGVLEIDRYHPLVQGEDREEMKQRLQKEMAWGDDEPKQQPKILKPIKKPVKTLPTKKETRNDILTQIRERVDWLADMEALGEGAAHRQLIEDQIIQKMRNLEALGVVSDCSSTIDSGFSTRRSSSSSINKKQKITSANSFKTAVPKQPNSATLRRKSGRIPTVEENVSAYGSFKLALSPRRRC